MATFDVHLEQAGAPYSHKVEALDAHDIGEAWELARQKYYLPVDDPNYTDFQIVRIDTPPVEGELSPLHMPPMFAVPGATAHVMGVGPAQGEPGFVAKQGVSLAEQMAHAQATGEKQVLTEPTTEE